MISKAGNIQACNIRRGENEALERTKRCQSCIGRTKLQFLFCKYLQDVLLYSNFLFAMCRYTILKT